MNREKILVSIIMPAYKAASFIADTLKSVKLQTYSNWELIVVEDGTDDGTESIIEEFKADVPQHVVYFKNKVNKGVSGTRNVAVSLSKGNWLAFLDSDDIWHKDHLLTSVNTALENPDYEILYSSHTKFYDDVESLNLTNTLDETLKDPPFLSKNLPTALFNGYMIQPSTVMLSSKLFHEVNGFNEDFRYVEDLLFFFKILAKGYQFKYTKKNTSYYKENPNGLTKDSIPMSYATAKVREQVAGLHLPELDKKTISKKTSEAWFLTARLSRSSDIKLAKFAIKKALRRKFSFKIMFFFILIHLKSS